MEAPLPSGKVCLTGIRLLRDTEKIAVLIGTGQSGWSDGDRDSASALTTASADKDTSD